MYELWSRLHKLTHVLEYQVNIVTVDRPMNIKQPDDVRVLAEPLQVEYLSVCSLSIGFILKGIKDLLQRYFRFWFFVYCSPYDTIRLKNAGRCLHFSYYAFRNLQVLELQTGLRFFEWNCESWIQFSVWRFFAHVSGKWGEVGVLLIRTMVKNINVFTAFCICKFINTEPGSIYGDSVMQF